MIEPLRRSFLAPMLATLAIGIAAFVAFIAASTTLDELEFLRKLPRATLAAPVKGPAVYRGRAFGPDNLVTPTKRRAAAVWWSVTTGGSKSRKVTCVGGNTAALAALVIAMLWGVRALIVNAAGLS